MPFPDSLLPGGKRNRMDALKQFLDEKYSKHYYIYNLSTKKYNSAKYVKSLIFINVMSKWYRASITDFCGKFDLRLEQI